MTASARVDSTRVDAHVAALQAAGIGLQRIADLSGVCYAVVYRHSARCARPSSTIAADAAERILALPVDVRAVAPRRAVRAIGTSRRLQALAALGWSRQALAARLGCTPSTVGTLMHADLCSFALAVAVRGLYDTMWSTLPAPGTGAQRAAVARTRNDAAARGWVTPLAWTDGTIDDPAAVPDVGAPAPRRTMADRIEDLDWLIVHDVEPVAACARAGFTSRAHALKALGRAGRGDVSARLIASSAAA